MTYLLSLTDGYESETLAVSESVSKLIRFAEEHDKTGDLHWEIDHDSAFGLSHTIDPDYYAIAEVTRIL